MGYSPVSVSRFIGKVGCFLKNEIIFRGVAQSGQRASFGTTRSGVRISPPRQWFRFTFCIVKKGIGIILVIPMIYSAELMNIIMVTQSQPVQEFRGRYVIQKVTIQNLKQLKERGN